MIISQKYAANFWPNAEFTNLYNRVLIFKAVNFMDSRLFDSLVNEENLILKSIWSLLIIEGMLVFNEPYNCCSKSKQAFWKFMFFYIETRVTLCVLVDSVFLINYCSYPLKFLNCSHR